MLNVLEENTQETSFGVNEDVVRDQSIVTSAREENNVVDVASRLPSSTEDILNSNNDEVVDDTDPDVKNSIKPVNNLASNVTSPREENNVVDVASRLPSSTESTLNSNDDEVVDDTDPDVKNSIKPVNNLAYNVNSPREENNVVNNASNLPSSTKGTLNLHSDKAVNDTDPDVDVSIQPVNTLASAVNVTCLLYTSPSPRDLSTSRMPSSA